MKTIFQFSFAFFSTKFGFFAGLFLLGYFSQLLILNLLLSNIISKETLEALDSLNVFFKAIFYVCCGGVVTFMGWLVKFIGEICNICYLWFLNDFKTELTKINNRE